MNAGQGFQFTPYGLTALGDASQGQPGEFAPSAPPAFASVPRPEPGDEYDGEPDARPVDRAFAKLDRAFAKHSALVADKLTRPAAIKPKDVLRLARARVREIRAELKRHAALQKELTQLENMLSAAKPLAPVRALETARRRAI